jgi:GNAT superfamily N-acetyltransferase
VVGAKHWLFDKLVYGKIRAAFGGKLRFAFSGGGPLGERLTHFFAGIGLDVYEGYGLTETSPTLTINAPGSVEAGHGGPSGRGTSIRIADDGEILAKGPQVFGGYWHNDTATAEVLRRRVVPHRRRGRARRRRLPADHRAQEGAHRHAAGKNVAPAPLEDRLRASALVSQAVVIGEGRPFVSALVTLDELAVERWCEAHGRAGSPIRELVDDTDLRAEIQQAVDAANASVSRAESIREFVVLPNRLHDRVRRAHAHPQGPPRHRREVPCRRDRRDLHPLIPVTVDPPPTSSAPEPRLHRLADGTRVLVRPLVPGDRAELVARYGELSSRSRRLRFVSAPAHLSNRCSITSSTSTTSIDTRSWRRSSTSPDRRASASPATCGARCDPTVADAAVTVVDAHQGRGIGTLLLTSLVAAAVINGIEVFTADVLWDNSELLDALRAVGAEVVPRSSREASCPPPSGEEAPGGTWT